MRKAIYLLLILAIGLSGLWGQVNGSLTQVNGKWIMHLWGTHQERGYAHGYLLNQPIMQIFNTYIFPIVAMSNPVYYNAMVNFYINNFAIDNNHLLEAQGILNGMMAANADIYIPALQRSLNEYDLLTFNCIVDLYYYNRQMQETDAPELHCASISSWGTATSADTLLAGSLVISRMMDWNQDGSLIANPLLMVSHPSEPYEQKWISFTYPGMIGALSAISETGKAAFLNTGNVHIVNNTNGLHPIFLSIRTGIETADFNNDGTDNITDIYESVAAELSLSGFIIHVVSENPGVMTGIIEVNNSQGAVLRTVLHNGALPGNHLAATNHFRLLNLPICCNRYEQIVDSLTANNFVTAKRQLAVLKGAAGMQNNMMLIQYVPQTGNILWSTATLSQPAYQNEMIALNRNDLFDFNTTVNEQVYPHLVRRLFVYPNPAKTGTGISIKSPLQCSGILEIFNPKGQRIAFLNSVDGNFYWDGKDSDGLLAGSGVYLLKLTDNKGFNYNGKVLILR